MKLLRVIATLDPRHGGPSAGLKAITPVLAAAGHETEFVSFDDPAEAHAFDSPAPLHALGPTPPATATIANSTPGSRPTSSDSTPSSCMAFGNTMVARCDVTRAACVRISSFRMACSIRGSAARIR
ncbi:MAG: hypothetical protein NVV63_08150 [Opitutus sp.]|nr:hypothetical protein [Opitutus sp.]